VVKKTVVSFTVGQMVGGMSRAAFYKFIKEQEGKAAKG
jgi:hypothetical protein